MSNTRNKPTPHPHAEPIIAWAKGAKIQIWNKREKAWKDCELPTWVATCQYRIKPEEEQSNEPWKPVRDEIFYIVNDMGYAVKCTWMDGCAYHNACYAHGNCFRTEKEAEAAAKRVEAALKGDTTNDVKVWPTENDIEGGLQLTIGRLKKRYRKLSKEILYNAFIAASNIVKPHGDWFKLMRNAAEALDSGTLEIEEYVREDHIVDVSKKVDGWTKFDPNDPKTFPPVGGFLYCKSYSGNIAYNVGYRASGDTEDHFSYYFWEYGMTHWRPLPKPPKMEVKKRTTYQNAPISSTRSTSTFTPKSK